MLASAVNSRLHTGLVSARSRPLASCSPTAPLSRGPRRLLRVPRVAHPRKHLPALKATGTASGDRLRFRPLQHEVPWPRPRSHTNQNTDPPAGTRGGGTTTGAASRAGNHTGSDTADATPKDEDPRLRPVTLQARVSPSPVPLASSPTPSGTSQKTGGPQLPRTQFVRNLPSYRQWRPRLGSFRRRKRGRPGRTRPLASAQALQRAALQATGRGRGERRPGPPRGPEPPSLTAPAPPQSSPGGNAFRRASAPVHPVKADAAR